MLLLIDIMTLSCYTDNNRSPGEGGGIGAHAEGKEISTFNKGAISISQYYLKVKSGAQAHWLLAEMGLQDHRRPFGRSSTRSIIVLSKSPRPASASRLLPQALCFSQ